MSTNSRNWMNDWNAPEKTPSMTQKMIDVYEEKIGHLQHEIEKLRTKEPSKSNRENGSDDLDRPGSEEEATIRFKRKFRLMREQRDEAINRMLDFQKELAVVLKDMNHMQRRCNDMVEANELLLRVAVGNDNESYLHQPEERIKVEWTGKNRIASPSFTQSGYGVRVNASQTALVLKPQNENGIRC